MYVCVSVQIRRARKTHRVKHFGMLMLTEMIKTVNKYEKWTVSGIKRQGKRHRKNLYDVRLTDEEIQANIYRDSKRKLFHIRLASLCLRKF